MKERDACDRALRRNAVNREPRHPWIAQRRGPGHWAVVRSAPPDRFVPDGGALLWVVGMRLLESRAAAR